MTTSNQNPSPTPTTTRRRILPAPSAPGTPPEQLGPPHLITGDDPAFFHNLRAQTHSLAGQPQDFSAFLADLLAAEAWEFTRDKNMRAAAHNLQISDDHTALSAEFDHLDDPTRQYLAFRTLAAEAPFRELLRDADRSFRRIRQTHQSLTTPTRSRKSQTP
jgi:hypothetical protein